MRKLIAVLAVLFNISTLSAQIEWNDSTSTTWEGDTVVSITPSTPTGKVTYINLSATELTLAGGSSMQLTATVNPDAAIKAVAWSIVDNSIATVSDNGIVNALKKGSTIVTATATDGTGITAQCFVTVTSDINHDIPITILDWGANEPWKSKYVYKDDVEQFYFDDPANDSQGRAWTMLDYDDSSWSELTGPMGMDIWYAPYNYSWSGEYNRHWLRRRFNVAFDVKDYVFTFECMHDDDIQVFVNGTMVIDDIDWTDERHVSFQIPSTCFRKGDNMLAVRLYQGWGGAYLDYTLFGIYDPESDIKEVRKQIQQLAEPIYDTFGRIVKHPHKGGIYIQGGRKCIIK